MFTLTLYWRAEGRIAKTWSASDNAAKTLIRGPGINKFDVAVFKNFSIREPIHAKFRFEFYNVFNHTQLTGLDTTARFDANGNQINSDLGVFTAAGSPRTLQLAVKIYLA